MQSLLLIDSHSLIHRCFHALPPFKNSRGEPTGALYGVASILLRIAQQRNFSHAATLFDRPEPTFRKEKFPEYKIHRPKAADELVFQLKEARRLFSAFAIKGWEIPGFEADDLIATLTRQFKKNILVRILTGDLDSLQLVEDGLVAVETFKTGISQTIVYNESAVKERYGLLPTQLSDFKALVGDVSDNIPGVTGVGSKTASTLLQKYGSLKNILERGKEETAYKKIATQEKVAILSKELATLCSTAPLSPSLDDLRFSPDWGRIREYLEQQDFFSLLKRLPEKIDHPAELPKKTISPSLSPSLAVVDSEVPFPVKNILSKKMKIGYDLKKIFHRHEIAPSYFDSMIAARLLGIDFNEWTDLSRLVLKKTVDKETFLLESFPWFNQRLIQRGLTGVFENIEMPLIPVLARMEREGIIVDTARLKRIRKDLNKEISSEEAKVFQSLGEKINLNSPKQLLAILKKKYHIPISSTSASKLEKVSKALPFVSNLLSYRELFKLKTTYLDGMERLVGEDEKIHPTFLQLGVATGRMSCQNPNLQNIPQESSWSPSIRNIFTPEEGFLFFSFDYSQIELRVLASLSKDSDMLRAFKKGGDIHTLTAKKVFSPNTKISHQERRLAKTLNFGIVYGMGFRAFSQNAGLPAAQAKEFINRYFKEFSRIKEWQSEILSVARKKGFITNENGRLRDLPGIHSALPHIVSEAERMAINMPIQSLAADILKLAMINTNRLIKRERLSRSVRLTLSIHDELLFQIDKKLITREKESPIILKIKELMESCYRLQTPLRVEVKMGEHWGEMK